jgi:hypothetical protein
MKREHIIGIVLVVALTAGFYWNYQRTMRCPDWALRHVQSLYIDLADGKMDSNDNASMSFSNRIKRAHDEITNQDCRVDYTAFASATLLKSTAEVRALAAAFLRRWGGAEYQP